MKIIVGSLNPQKIKAVADLVTDYDFLKDAEVIGFNSPSGVSEQPKTLEETVRGAMNRARSAFNNTDYSFGIESGLSQVPYTKTGIMDLTVCAIYDGEEFYLGISSAFEPPKCIFDLMHHKGLDMTQATVEAGLTDNPKLGASEGLIGILTNGRLNRLEYTKQAVLNALMHLEFRDVYKIGTDTNIE